MYKTKHHWTRALSRALTHAMYMIMVLCVGIIIGITQKPQVTTQDVIDHLAIGICEIETCVPVPERKPK